MATPPPEAAPVLKEEKPQLPPSPTGASAPDVAPTSRIAYSATNDVKMHGTDTPTDKKSPVLNGNGHPAVASVTNGTSSAATSAVIPKPSDAVTIPAMTSNTEDKPAITDAPASTSALESGPLAGGLDGSTDGKMELDGPQEPPCGTAFED
ncbi:uncharacterized protein N7483_008704 [Penicillium malachiteum]|uniref:uncharacterized protein n=1 Tax=Penicillium malachiteum TaxID=1324776 RepID=UPI002548CE01|nr:uncharacterized protein N7483_008704 [Penicillium malachiteum]KAJ5720770.1 hypothetical protein N7483_008704 [Penicillium malachiteum]